VLSSYPRSLTAVGGTLFFAANDGATGFELWTSDGTAAGTALVADILPGPYSSDPSNLTAVGGTLFFATSNFFLPVASLCAVWSRSCHLLATSGNPPSR
jgi:ELWxxDGT repeat protein